MASTSACLAAEEKEALASWWTKLAPEASVVGGEALFRFLEVCPATKSYFSHFDLSKGSPDLLSHGEKIVIAIGEGIKDLDNLSTVMIALTELHTNKLKVALEHMKDLICTIMVTLARNYPDDFTPECQYAWKKYLWMLRDVLLSKSS
uniref:Globin domain-containing protein n=1 Tax=Leptobrachium leishanense TaxID=445787 RepID=A0A8C5MXM1_9ANUR